MVAGSGVTAFADSATSGSSVGTGASEGHMNKHVIDVELPTVETGSTPFTYTIDPERLIQATNGAKHSGATFPSADSDTGVYFLTGSGTAGDPTYSPVATPDAGDLETYYEQVTTPATYDYEKTEDTSVNSDKTYYEFDEDDEGYDVVSSPVDGDIQNYYEKVETTSASTSYIKTEDTSIDDSKTYYAQQAASSSNMYENTSETLTATSKSSADVKLTVSVAASSASTDIPLVEAAPASTVTEPQLYLALLVGDETTVIKAGQTVSKEVTIAGKDENFEASVVDNEYKYVAKTGNGVAWNSKNFKLTGAVSKASAEGLTVPTLTVTWKYEDPAATDTSSNSNSNSTSTTPTVTNATLEVGATANTYVKPTDSSATTSSTLTIGYGSYEAVTVVQFEKDGTWKNFGATQTNAVWSDSTKTLTIKDSYLAGKDSGFKIRFVFDDDTDKALVVTFN